jgi:hypothetical protein
VLITTASISLLDQLAEVLVDFRFSPVLLLDGVEVFLDAAVVHIAESYNFDTGFVHELVHVVAAHAMAADDTQRDLVVGAHRVLGGGCRLQQSG